MDLSEKKVSIQKVQTLEKRLEVELCVKRNLIHNKLRKELTFIS